MFKKEPENIRGWLIYSFAPGPCKCFSRGKFICPGLRNYPSNYYPTPYIILLRKTPYSSLFNLSFDRHKDRLCDCSPSLSVLSFVVRSISNTTSINPSFMLSNKICAYLSLGDSNSSYLIALDTSINNRPNSLFILSFLIYSDGHRYLTLCDVYPICCPYSLSVVCIFLLLPPPHHHHHYHHLFLGDFQLRVGWCFPR